MKAPVRLLLLGAILAAPVAVAQSPGNAAAFRSDCSSFGDRPKSWEGSAYAVDGDTLAAVGLKARLKLWGIRAPALMAPFGGDTVAAMRARAALEDMLVSAEHKVSCRLTGAWDEFCRAVAQCAVTAAWPSGSAPQPHDLALRLVEDGFAYGAGLDAPPEWDKDAGEKIAHFEAIARQARKGLWSLWLGEQPKP